MAEAADSRPYGRGGWSAGWLEVLAELPGVTAMDLITGRAWVREGRVGRMRVEPGIVSAWVSDEERAQPYPVVLTVPVLADAVWDRFLDALRAQSGHVAALLDGEPPVGMGVDRALLPGPGELRTICPCPRRDRQPCRHAAAAGYQTAAEIDADPFALLLLRGRSKAQLLDALREERTRAVPSSAFPGRLATAAYRTAPAPLPPVPQLAPDPDDPGGFTVEPIPDPPAVSGLTGAELTDLAQRAARAARALLTRPC